MHIEIVTTLDYATTTYRLAVVRDSEVVSIRRVPAFEIARERNREVERWSEVAASVHATLIPELFLERKGDPQ